MLRRMQLCPPVRRRAVRNRGTVPNTIKRDGIQNRIPKTKAINLAYSEAYRLIYVWPMLAQCSRHRDGMPLWCLECGVTIVIT